MFYLLRSTALSTLIITIFFAYTGTTFAQSESFIDSWISHKGSVEAGFEYRKNPLKEYIVTIPEDSFENYEEILLELFQKRRAEGKQFTILTELGPYHLHRLGRFARDKGYHLHEIKFDRKLAEEIFDAKHREAEAKKKLNQYVDRLENSIKRARENAFRNANPSGEILYVDYDKLQNSVLQYVKLTSQKIANELQKQYLERFLSQNGLTKADLKNNKKHAEQVVDFFNSKSQEIENQSTVLFRTVTDHVKRDLKTLFNLLSKKENLEIVVSTQNARRAIQDFKDGRGQDSFLAQGLLPLEGEKPFRISHPSEAVYYLRTHSKISELFEAPTITTNHLASNEAYGFFEKSAELFLLHSADKSFEALDRYVSQLYSFLSNRLAKLDNPEKGLSFLEAEEKLTEFQISLELKKERKKRFTTPSGLFAEEVAARLFEELKPLSRLDRVSIKDLVKRPEQSKDLKTRERLSLLAAGDISNNLTAIEENRKQLHSRLFKVFVVEPSNLISNFLVEKISRVTGHELYQVKIGDFINEETKATPSGRMYLNKSPDLSAIATEVAHQLNKNPWTLFYVTGLGHLSSPQEQRKVLETLNSPYYEIQRNSGPVSVHGTMSIVVVGLATHTQTWNAKPLGFRQKRNGTSAHVSDQILNRLISEGQFTSEYEALSPNVMIFSEYSNDFKKITLKELFDRQVWARLGQENIDHFKLEQRRSEFISDRNHIRSLESIEGKQKLIRDLSTQLRALSATKVLLESPDSIKELELLSKPGRTTRAHGGACRYLF